MAPEDWPLCSLIIPVSATVQHAFQPPGPQALEGKALCVPHQVVKLAEPNQAQLCIRQILLLNAV